MRRHELTDTQWEQVSNLMRRGRGRKALRGDKNFVNAVVWIAKTGAPWRDLPERFGPWKSIFNRFSEWAKANRWNDIFKALAISDDDDGSLMDGSVIRAHQDSCGGKGGQKKLNRSLTRRSIHQDSSSDGYQRDAVAHRNHAGSAA